jgi:hypothetical protein
VNASRPKEKANDGGSWTRPTRTSPFSYRRQWIECETSHGSREEAMQELRVMARLQSSSLQPNRR